MGGGLFVLFWPQIERTKDLVLVGGGHSHVIAIKMLGMQAFLEHQITLISSATDTLYSGMLPGLLAGYYNYDDTHIDLMRLCQWAGVRFIQAEVIGVDKENKRLSLKDRPEISYDTVSFDVGATQNLAMVNGASTNVIPIKPISKFWGNWCDLKKKAINTERIAVVGGGAGSVELVLAMARSLSNKEVSFDLYCGSSRLLPEYNKLASQSAIRALERFDVAVHLDAWVDEVTSSRILLSSQKSYTYDHIFWCTAAASTPWLAASGLSLDENGFIATRDTLQSLDDEDIFAVGDCATQINQPRPKAGVFAVRQGPVLAHNLRARLLGKKLKLFRPQKRFLSILSLGSKTAIAIWGPFFVSARWVWEWKNFLDRQFLKQFNVLTDMPIDQRINTAKIAAKSNSQPFCGGCGAKISADILSKVLSHLNEVTPGHCRTSNEDAQEIGFSNQPFWQSIDALRQIVSDPWLMGQLAANHALSDLYASGLKPHSVQALITIPFAAPKLQARELSQILQGALTVFSKTNCVLVGGHSMLGSELQIAFSVNGYSDSTISGHLRKQGLSEGEKLVITKPLGSGVLFAAHMQSIAKGKHIESALLSMMQCNSVAAKLCLEHGVKGATDITGFGLAVHLNEMLSHDQGAIINTADLPSFPGALSYLKQGVRSTNHNSNRHSVEECLLCPAGISLEMELLFDPQTCGGILFGVDPLLNRELKDKFVTAGLEYYELGEIAGKHSVIELR